MAILPSQHRFFIYYPVCLLLFFAQYAQAQDSERPKPDWENVIETDGPDFTEASSLIPAGTIQVETGVIFTSDKSDGVKTAAWAYPATLIRVGLLPAMELRLIGEYVQERHSPDTAAEFRATRGMGPLVAGVKLFVCEEKGLRPETAFLGHVMLSSGSHHYRPTFTSSQFRFSMGHTLSDRFSLGYNLGYEWDGITPEGAAIYTLALGYTFTKRWSAYVELYGDKPETDPFAHAAAGGIKFFLAPNWQMDISGGHAITDNADDYYFAYGLRFRLPY